MRIITDSSSDLTPELIERFKVDLVIPMKISIDGKEYLDKVDIQDEPFYHEILPACQSLPKTSQVTANEFCEIFSRYPDEELVVLPISSGLSGTYSAALVAKEMLGRKDIYVVDNKATALALALMVQIACEKRDAGLSAREVAEQVEALSGRVRVYALVETLRYLVLGGRLSKAAGLVGSALNLKPIITLKGGVLSAVVLGVGRALGETMAVIMVAGNQPWIPSSILQGVRTLTANIVIEMSYAADLHREMLIATGVVLFTLVLLLNLCFSALNRRKEG